MIPWLKRLLFDHDAWIGYLRGGVLVAAFAVADGHGPPWFPGWAGYALVGLAGMIRAGDTNPPRPAVTG
jgi:drug/metabolite transporter (DMT)-like permease